MSLTNSGFDGTVTEAAYAYMWALGGLDGVESSAAWAVTQGTGRQVSVAAQSGYAFARGVLSKETASPLLKALGTPVNGQWYLIVRRINWASNTVTIEAIAHTTTSTTIPTAADAPTTYPAMSTTPGTEYDQVLAWAWVRSTDTTVFIVDLRKLPPVGRLAALETILVGAGRGTAASYTVATLTDLDAISTALVGDQAFMTAPGTGINPLRWVCIGGSAGTARDWAPMETVVADTKTNLDNFIAAAVLIAGTDVQFRVGGEAYLTTNGIRYRFVTTAGAHVIIPGPIIPINASAGSIQPDGWVTFAGVSGITLDNLPVDVLDFGFEIDLELASAAAALGFNLRDAGADLGANYAQERHTANNGADTTTAVGGLSNWSIGTASAIGFHRIVIELNNVTVAKRKQGSSYATFTTNPMALATASMDRKSLFYSNADIATGIKFAPASGTITGRIRASARS